MLIEVNDAAGEVKGKFVLSLPCHFELDTMTGDDLVSYPGNRYRD